MQRHYVISYFYSIGCKIVNWVTAIGCVHIAESVGSRSELVANSCTHRRRRRDATRQFRRVGGVYWALKCIHFILRECGEKCVYYKSAGLEASEPILGHNNSDFDTEKFDHVTGRCTRSSHTRAAD